MFLFSESMVIPIQKYATSPKIANQQTQMLTCVIVAVV